MCVLWCTKRAQLGREDVCLQTSALVVSGEGGALADSGGDV